MPNDQETSTVPALVAQRSRLRVLNLASHPIQYYVPIYRKLAVRPDIDLTVCFTRNAGSVGFIGDDFNRSARWDIPLLDGYKFEFLDNNHGNNADPNVYSLSLRLVPFLLRADYHVLWVIGYSTITASLALLLGHIRGAPVLVMDDAILLKDRPKIRRLAKRLILPLMFRHIYGLYAGTENRRFFRNYGMREANLFFTPHSVDNAYFQEQAHRLSTRKQDLRRRFGLPADGPVLLFCGKLIPRKDLFTLLRAFALVRRAYRCTLLIVGDGPLRDRLEQFVEAEGISDVQISGFLNQTEIGLAYAAADAFVLPSRSETWGLVVNEAMNFSLPIIASDRVGCAVDLVRSGENGYIFQAGSVDALADCIRHLVLSKQRRLVFGHVSRQIIDNWDTSRTAASIVEACYACSNAASATRGSVTSGSRIGPNGHSRKAE